MFGSLLAGPCTTIVSQGLVRQLYHKSSQIYRRGLRLRSKNSFNEILGRFTFCVCFRANEIIAERAVLLTEMTCESQAKSKIPAKKYGCLPAKKYGCLDKNSPWMGGWEVGTRAQFTRRNKFILLTNFIY